MSIMTFIAAQLCSQDRRDAIQTDVVYLQFSIET